MMIEKHEMMIFQLMVGMSDSSFVENFKVNDIVQNIIYFKILVPNFT